MFIHLRIIGCWLLFSAALLCATAQKAQAADDAAIGLFQSHADIGAVLHPGSVDYNSSAKTYTITGSGENMWFASDNFQFVWKKVSGDITLTADISILGTTGDPHRKGLLMVRQSLNPDAAYADVALHGDGLTSLQFRKQDGAITREVGIDKAAPKRLRIEKHGNYFYMWIADEGESLRMSGASTKLVLKEPFYVGLGVCAHNKDASQTVSFNNVDLSTSASINPPTLYSTLETITVASTDRRITYTQQGRLGSANWTHDGASLLFNDSHSQMKRIKVGGGELTAIDLGSVPTCSNTHLLSADGTLLTITDVGKTRKIYTLPIAGGEPKRIGKPMKWITGYGWSPDGKTLAVSGGKNGKSDIYLVPAAGKKSPARLTKGESANDTPEYSPDGKYIYFTSDRSGTWQIWRMTPDGTGSEQITNDSLNNTFPHISPDGTKIVFLSYEEKSTGAYPQDKEVTLRVLALADRKIKALAEFIGGQGTLESPSWSPDSRRLAFTSYQLVPKE